MIGYVKMNTRLPRRIVSLVQGAAVQLLRMFCVGAVLSFAVAAQSYSLDDYLTAALFDNPQIGHLRALVTGAQENEKTATRLSDPLLSMDIPFSRPEGAAVSLEQHLPWVSKLTSKKKIAASNVTGTLMKLRNAENDLLSMVRADYYQLYEKGKVVELLSESLELIKQAIANAHVSYANGTVPQAAVLKLQLEAALLEDRILQTRTKAEAIRDALVAKTGLSREKMLFPDELPFLPVPDSLDQIITLSVDQNPLVAAFVADSIGASEGVHLSRAMLIPDAMIGIKVADVFSGPPMPMALVGISLPVWVRKNGAAIRASEANLDAARKQLEQEVRDLTSETTTLFRDYRDTERRITLLDNVLVPTADQVLSSVEAGYRTSMMSVLEYLDAQRALIDLKVERVTLETKREIIAAEIVLCCLGASNR